MKRLFDLRINGEVSGGPLGGTAPYDVVLLEKCTVREFVEYVLDSKKEDWGYISINNWSTLEFNDKKNPFFGYPHIKYSNGRLSSSIIEDFGEFLDKPVGKATANGGWSRMDYILYV